jgi:hypothetical protein
MNSEERRVLDEKIANLKERLSVLEKRLDIAK